MSYVSKCKKDVKLSKDVKTAGLRRNSTKEITWHNEVHT